MNKESENRCACCGVPVKPGVDLCSVCARETTARTAMQVCRACEASNPTDAEKCGQCGAPLAVEPKREKTPTDIVGRRAVLQVLEDVFSMCMDNRQVGGAIVSGDSGMGTSSVLRAFYKRLGKHLPDHRVFYVVTRDNNEAFSPLRGALLKWLNLEKESDQKVRRLKLIERVGKVLGPKSAARVTETSQLIGYVAGVPFPKGPVLKLLETDPAAMEKRIVEVLLDFLKEDLAKEPAAILFDDMHLAPEDACRFTMHILNSLRGVPLTVVVAGRPQVNKITDKTSVVRISLDPLDDETMYRIFEQLMPNLHSPPQDLVDATIGRANGNPGSLGQLCQLLIESGVVDTSTDPWTADVNKLAMADMPVSLLDALKARIDQLDPRDRSVLEFAAIFGEVFWDETIIALSHLRTRLKENIGAAQIWSDDSDGLAISSSLNRLVDRQFIVQLPDSDVSGCIKYAFARSGIRNDIISGMDKEKVRLGHVLSAQWLAHTAGNTNHGFSEAEAAHWATAGENRRAAYAYFRAARRAKSRYLNQKAIKLFQRGIKLADETDRLILADAQHDLGSLFDLLGDYDEAETSFTEMLKCAWILMHRGKAGAALNRIGRLYRARGDIPAARAFLNRGMVLFKAAGDEKGVAACLGDLGELARRQGKYDRAFQLVSEALELQRKIDNKPSIAVCLHRLGHIEAARASYKQAEKLLEEALEFRRQTGDKGGLAQTLSTLAIVLFNRGNLDSAIARWEAALELSTEVGDRRLQAIVNNNIGEALRDQGQLDRSMKYFKACEGIVEKLDDRILLAEVSRNMGILAQKMGNIELAKNHLTRSLDLSKELGGREKEGLAYRALGELESSTMWDTSNVGGEDTAGEAFDKALAIFKSIGNDFEIARTLHARGNRRLELGDLEGGKQFLEEAKQIFNRIDSKAGDRISRTISEIMGQKPPRPPEAARKQKRSKGNSIPPAPPSKAKKVSKAPPPPKK